MSQETYRLINLTADVITTWPTAFGTGVTIQDINEVNASAGPFSIILPDATLVTPVVSMQFNNISGNSFNIKANDGTTLITTVSSGLFIRMYLYDSSTANGLWRVAPPGSGPTAITHLSATSSNNTIVISGSPIAPTGGTLDFALTSSLYNFNNISNTGFITVTGTAPLTFASRTMAGDSNISISNANGSAGNPTWQLQPNLVGLTSVTVGGIYLTGNSVSAVTTNTDLTFSTSGTGDISLNGVLIDTIGNISAVGNLTVNGVFNNALLPKVSVTFNDTLVSDTHVITIIDSSNGLLTITRTTNGNYAISFGLTLSNNNYGVQITAGTNGGSTPTMLLCSYITSTMTTTGVTIEITDLSGIPVTSLPYGATVQIIQS